MCNAEIVRKMNEPHSIIILREVELTLCRFAKSLQIPEVDSLECLVEYNCCKMFGH